MRHPARQRGASGGVWSWGGIAGEDSGSKGAGRSSGWLGADAARRGFRVDAALSPGLTIPDPQGPRSRSLARSQGAPPGLRTASPVLPQRNSSREGSARQRLRLIRAEARGRRPRRRGAGCRGRFAVMAAGPVPALYSSARGRPRRGPPGPRAPLSFSRAARPARPHNSDPNGSRERSRMPLNGGDFR